MDRVSAADDGTPAHWIDVQPGAVIPFALAIEDAAAGPWCRDAIRRGLGLPPLAVIAKAQAGQDGIPCSPVKCKVTSTEFAALRDRAESAGVSAKSLVREYVSQRVNVVIAARGGAKRLGLTADDL